MMALRIQVLGVPRVDVDQTSVRLSPSAVHVLAFLALGPREGRARASMAAQLFRDCPDGAARRRLATALWRLKNELGSALGRNVIECAGDARVRLAPDVPLSVDALEFLSTVRAVISQPVQAATADDVRVLEAAVRGYAGELLESSYDDWVLEQRTRLADAYVCALDYLIQRLDNPDRVIEFSARALELEPLREDLHRHVMGAYARVGRVDLVEHQFEACRLTLLRELGADPMPETVALYARLTVGAGLAAAPDLAALVADLQRARQDLQQLAALVDRALDAVARLR